MAIYSLLIRTWKMYAHGKGRHSSIVYCITPHWKVLSSSNLRHSALLETPFLMVSFSQNFFWTPKIKPWVIVHGFFAKNGKF